jgi:DNA-binding NarL/FixJ family response regulator
MPDLTKFLIIDDSASDAGHLRACIRIVAGYQVDVRETSTAAAALEAVKVETPELVFTDHLSPTDTAFATILKLRGIGYKGPVVVVTGHRDPATRQQLLAAGAVAVVDKDDLDAALLAQTLAKVREKLVEPSSASSSLKKH